MKIRHMKDRLKGLEKRLERAEALLRCASIWMQCEERDGLLKASEKILQFLSTPIDTEAE